MIKLIHHSNRDIKDKINPEFFGDNTYTFNDKKHCQINRAFFYTDTSQIEYNLQGARYIYLCQIEKKYIYNLHIDNLQLKNKFNTIPELLQYIKNQYKGASYRIGDLHIVILFESVKIQDKIKRGV